MFEIESLEVTAGSDVAFAFALLRCGKPTDFERDPERLLRLTVDLRKALLGSTATAVYRSQVLHAIPAGVPPHVAAVSMDTLAGALSVARQLPSAAAHALVAGARAAFTDAWQVAHEHHSFVAPSGQ